MTAIATNPKSTPTTKPLPEVDVKAAVATALTAFNEFYPSLMKQDLMLEEVEESQDGKCWLITLGFDVKRKFTGFAAELAQGFERSERAYKSFKIDKATGKVLSMKIRSVA